MTAHYEGKNDLIMELWYDSTWIVDIAEKRARS